MSSLRLIENIGFSDYFQNHHKKGLNAPWILTRLLFIYKLKQKYYLNSLRNLSDSVKVVIMINLISTAGKKPIHGKHLLSAFCPYVLH